MRLRPWPDGVAVQVVDGLRVVPVGMAIAQVTDEYGFLPGLVCLDGALHTEQVTGPQVEIFDRRGKIGRVDFLVGQAMSRPPRPCERRREGQRPWTSAIQASTSSAVCGQSPERLRQPSSVTTTSSSRRTPMPRNRSGTLRSSALK